MKKMRKKMKAIKESGSSTEKGNINKFSIKEALMIVMVCTK